MSRSEGGVSRSEGGAQSPQKGRLNIISAKEDGGADTKKKENKKKESKRSREVAAAAGGESYTPDVSQAAFSFFSRSRERLVSLVLTILLD